MQFDHAAAWMEVAQPAYDSLPAEVLAVYLNLRDAPECEGLAQNRNLLVPMPEHLRASFEALDSETLSYAAHVLHYYGHWYPSSLIGPNKDTRVASWKFSNIADQILRKRLGLPALASGGTAGFKSPIGYTFQVHEGMLRLSASSTYFWMWREVAPATQSGMECAQAYRDKLTGPTAGPCMRSSPRRQEYENAAHAALDSAKDLPEQLRAGLPVQWVQWMDVAKRYMRPKGKLTGDCPECGRSKLFRSEAANHEMHCSQFPIASRIDGLLRYADIYGITKPQQEAIRALILNWKD
jgi:hypothetical protein